MSTRAVKLFQAALDRSIDSAISLHGKTGFTTLKTSIGLTDIEVKRVTVKLRQEVNTYCKCLKVKVEYSEPARAFNIDIDLDKVVMSVEQAKAHVTAMQSRKEAV